MLQSSPSPASRFSEHAPSSPPKAVSCSVLSSSLQLQGSSLKRDIPVTLFSNQSSHHHLTFEIHPHRAPNHTLVCFHLSPQETPCHHPRRLSSSRKAHPSARAPTCPSPTIISLPTCQAWWFLPWEVPKTVPFCSRTAAPSSLQLKLFNWCWLQIVARGRVFQNSAYLPVKGRRDVFSGHFFDTHPF